MTRLTSIEKGGFYPFPSEYLPALASLFAPPEKVEHTDIIWRMIDPCAGEGEALKVLSEAWGLTPYANELDPSRANVCKRLFGPLQAVEGDLYQLRAPTGAFLAGWINPPYVWDKTAGERRELHMLKQSIKWIQTGGYALWCVYQHNVTAKAAEFLARYSESVDVWRMPGLHLDTYVHVVLVARMGKLRKSQSAFVQDILNKASNPRMLEILPEPIYTFPAPRRIQRFYFAPKVLTPEIIQAAAQQEGAHLAASFQACIAAEPPQERVQPLVQPSNGQLALILAAGLFNGMIIHNSDGSRIALRGKIEQREELEETSSTGEGEASVDKETYRTRPRTTITTLDANGTISLVDNDQGVVDIIQNYKDQLLAYMAEHFAPLYQFDPEPETAELLNAIRINGYSQLWETQKHIVAAAYAGLRFRRGLYLVGEPGIGKTAMGVALMLLMQRKARQGQTCLVMAPPHLVPKWEREAHQICIHLGQRPLIATARRIEDVTQFMTQATRLPTDTLKLLILPREAAKLGEGWTSAVVWKEKRIAQWKPGEERPKYLKDRLSPRIVRLRNAHCPVCGEIVTRWQNGAEVPATQNFLNNTKHRCQNCKSPLWQETRSFSAPAKGQKFPTKNPRYPLADFIAKRFSNRILLFVPDEVHELKSTATGQGLAMQQLAGIARYMVGTTGTLYGGTASSLYGLEFVINPRVRTKFPWALNGINRWVKRMGVMEREIEYKPDYDEHGRYTGKRAIEKKPAEAPGCSPELVSEIIDHVIMAGLLDTGRQMPSFEEIAIPIRLDPDMQSLYDKTKEDLGKYLFQCALDGDNTFIGAYLQGFLSWPTAAFRPEPFIHRKKHAFTDAHGEEVTEVDEFLVATLPGLGDDRIYPKEQWLLDTINDELARGRKVGVFCRQTGTRDIQTRLERLIREHAPLAKPWIMYGTKVKAEQREERLNRELQNGVNILICNPILVQTGLDLVDFPTLIFYEVNYSLFVMGQASRRAWRIIQDRPCSVYYPYYEECMEERAVTLVGRKQAAANLLAGQGTGQGLSAFTGGLGGSDGLLSALADNFNQKPDTNPAASLFGAVDVQINRATSTWLTGIDLHPQAFIIEGIATPVQETIAPETPAPEPVVVTLPPEKPVDLLRPAPRPRKSSRADLSRAPDEEPIPVADWPTSERKNPEPAPEPEYVQLTLF